MTYRPHSNYVASWARHRQILPSSYLENSHLPIDLPTRIVAPITPRIPDNDNDAYVNSSGTELLPDYSPPARKTLASQLRKRYPLHRVVYSSHPVVIKGWKKYIRVVGWYSVLWKRQKEMMDCKWPEGWSSSPPPTPSALPPPSVTSKHDLEHLYLSHLSTLNSLISSTLSTSRIMMVSVEIFNFILAILFIAALIEGSGRQEIFLEACELILVLDIVALAAIISMIRVSLPSSFSISIDIRY
jgi:hypothetical protein